MGLMTWANGVAHLRGRFPVSDRGSGDGGSQSLFVIDQVSPEDPSVERYCKYQEGQPVLSARDGGGLSLKDPENALRYCVVMLNEDLKMVFTVGIRDRLSRLAERWRNAVA